MRDDRERLRDILEAIDHVERYAAEGREPFEQSELIQNWMVSHLRIIGEACRGLSDEFRASHAGVPWSDIIGMRNILVHQYFRVDLEIVWSAVERELPKLKSEVRRALDGLPERQ